MAEGGVEVGRRTAVDALDLSRLRHIHVANVGGAGMSAVATLLAEMGHAVTGHDPAVTPFLERLRRVGVEVATGSPQSPLAAATDAVVTSTATPDSDPAVTGARARGIPVVHRSVALGALCRHRHALAVAGTHGKTTTSAMLATVLARTGRSPGWVVGAQIGGLDGNAAWGSADGPLVVEADESDGTFLALGARAAIVTNVEPDHLEHWGDVAGLRDAFRRFVGGVDGPVVLGADDPGAAALADAALRPVRCGRTVDADYRIGGIAPWGSGVRFELEHGAQRVEVTLPAAPGAHNAANAAAALALAHELGVGLADGAAALAGFAGVARRFEPRGEAAGVTLIDSYDHLPTEVQAALAAASGGRESGRWQRVVCCFQPHRYTRTAALWREFAGAFRDADLVAVTDVYPAGEPPQPGITGKLVVDAVLDADPDTPVRFLPGLDEVVDWLADVLRPGDLCLTLGAGDLTTIPPRVLARLEDRT